MSKPLVTLLSCNSTLTADLHVQLKDRFCLAICDSLDEADEFFASNIANLFVVDFGNIDNGGHREARFLDALHETFPELGIILLTENHCPEPLARSVACGEITHVEGEIVSECVAGLISTALENQLDHIAVDKTDRKEAQKTRVKNKTAGNAAKAVLSGITRNFETNTPYLKQMLAELEIAAKHNVTILLVGETGSGKTFLSKLIHEVSPRGDDPFLTVACGALPSELIESELFGHVKGAFTSAHADKDGKFVAAEKGTVLLDEIDVLSPEQQVKLLRVIETGEFEPVGSNQTLKSQARLVVASNLDLQPLVEQARFRPDLYYRLNMLKFEIPPLRERKPDIKPLAEKFVEEMAEKHGIRIDRVEPSLFAALLNYPWPGNVRELENVIQRAVIYCSDGVLTANHLPSHILSGVAGPTNDPSVKLGDSSDDKDSSLNQRIAFTEKDIIKQTLLRNNFSRTNTAKDLSISRVTLYNKMKKYGMSN